MDRLEQMALEYLGDLQSSWGHTDKPVMVKALVENLGLTEDEAVEVYKKWRDDADKAQ